MNFVRKIWEARLVENFNEASVLTAITTAPTEMTGSSIVFNRAAGGNIDDYEGSIEWTAADTAKVEMTFDHKKYFADKVDDIDKAQTNLAMVDAFAVAEAASLAEAADAYAYGVYVDDAGTELEIEVAKPEDIYDGIVALGVALGKKKVPVANRYVVIGWDALGLLEKDARFTHNADVLANGIVNGQKINGMTIVVTANIADGTILAFHKSAVGFGQQLNELEGLRLQDAFADGIRGLSVAGAAVLNDNGVATLAYTLATADDEGGEDEDDDEGEEVVPGT